ncbi:MAG: heparinase II/III family protein, partial [Candidatus Hydrogenedentota bacterium]
QYEGSRRAWGMAMAGCALLARGAADGAAAQDDAAEQGRQAREEPVESHPRLFFSAGEAEQIRERNDSDPLLADAWSVLRDQADAMLDLDPIEREQVGRRLLGVSRTALRRVSYLAFAYRMTGEEAYLDKAEEEMLAAAGFSDWNPSHFLDVGEMTAALAIGYDWLYDDLSSESRETIREAIVDKGLQTSFDQAGWWVDATNNWSPVCHGGLTMGALAVMEDEPALAEDVIVRAMENIHRPMNAYGPNGGYPEGPGYWSYGTSFNVLLIDALASALGQDFGLSEHERFMASSSYYLHMHGPTLGYFNYSDNSESSSVNPPMYWFARKLDEPSLLWMEQRKLAEFVETTPSASGSGGRLFPFLLIWAPTFDTVDPPAELHYVDKGEPPVGVHRTAWDENATYIGIKGGSPSAPHGQMDVGSFVMDAQGVRWGVDLGVQSYHSIEAEGMNLWDTSQDGDRWTVFRWNNRSKNTLVVNDELQRVDGTAPIIAFSDEPPMPHTITDMSEVYEGQLAESVRGAALLENGAVVIQDELKASDDTAEVRWGMVTRADVEIVDSNQAILREDGEELGFHVLEGEGVSLEIYNTETPPKEYDHANPGTRMIGFTVNVEPDAEARFTVLLNPGGLAEDPPSISPLSEW